MVFCCDLSVRSQQQHLDSQTVFSHYIKILCGCLNMIKFLEAELYSLCFASNQKEITLVFHFPVVSGKRDVCCLDSSRSAVFAASIGTSLPLASVG